VSPRSRPGSNAQELRRLVQKFVRDFGLLAQDSTPCGKPLATSHAHALMLLLEQERPISQKELGDALGIDKSNVTRLCQKMEAEGQVALQRGDEDARVRLLSLTARGAKLAQEVEQASKDRFASLLKAVPASERARVFEGLDLLSKAVNALQSEASDDEFER
jgi:DNA-binding MarR family transcriptional regulator